MKELWVKRFVISTFVVLYSIVSIISTIHVIDFFELSNPYWLAVSLAIAFEFGAAASLASLVALEKMNKGIVWALFFTITAMQMQGNMYYAFKDLHDYQSWIELFNLVEWEPLAQKRVLAFVSGAILPLVALGFIKSLVDYIKPGEDDKKIIVEKVVSEESSNMIDNEIESYEDLRGDDFIDQEVPAAPLYVEKTAEEVVEGLPEDVIDEILNGEELFIPQETENDAPIVQTLDEEKSFEAGKKLFQNQVDSLNKQDTFKGIANHINSSTRTVGGTRFSDRLSNS